MIYANAGDPLYNIWVFAKSYLPYLQVSYLHPNIDPDHILLPAQPAIDFIGKLIARVVSADFAYNSFIIAGFILTFVASYLLATKFTKQKISAALVALIITFLPYRVIHSQFHLNLTSTQWLLFFIYFLWELKDTPSYRNSLLLGVFGSLTILDNYQYGVFALLVAIVFFVALLTDLRQFKKTVGLLLFAALISISLTSIFDSKLLHSFIGSESLNHLGPTRAETELNTYSAKWLYYFAPPPELHSSPSFVSDQYQKVLYNLKTTPEEQTLYLGWVAVLLAVIGVTRGKSDRQKKIFIYLLFSLAFLLSFAPKMNIFGYEITSPSKYIFERFPVIRVYSRFGFLAGIATALLAGIGFDAILKKTDKKAIFWFIIFVVLIGFEFAPRHPFPIYQTNKLPEVYKKAMELGPGPIADYPLLPSDEPKGYEYLLWQTIHHMPIVYGASPAQEADLARKEVLNPENESTIDILEDNSVKYLIIHKDKYYVGDDSKYPVEYNGGKVPEINDSRVDLIECVADKCLYQINTAE